MFVHGGVTNNKLLVVENVVLAELSSCAMNIDDGRTCAGLLALKFSTRKMESREGLKKGESILLSELGEDFSLW